MSDFDPRDARAGAIAARAVIDRRAGKPDTPRSNDPAERHRTTMIQAERQFEPDRARIREQAAADIEGWIAEATPRTPVDHPQIRAQVARDLDRWMAESRAQRTAEPYRSGIC